MDTLFVALRVALSLGVVLALLWVLQKRIAKGVRRPGRASSSVVVVGRQGIGAKASVVVVDVEDLPLEQVCDTLLHRLGGDAEDDVALLAVRLG